MGGINQLLTSLDKNFIEKRRNVKSTCCEYLSHMVIISIIIMGYSFSDIYYFDESTYDTVEVTVPPLQSVDSLNTLLSGPLPVPPLSTYLRLGQIIAPLYEGNRDLQKIIDGSEYGQQFSNLLYTGDLHLAPDSPEVRDLYSYLLSLSPVIHMNNTHIHKSESKAIKYILNHLETRAFALIVVHEVSVAKVNYEIRQNYTTLPNTNRVVNWISLGLDTEYQRYYLSGYLSIKQSVDAWAFRYVQQQIFGNRSADTCTAPNAIAMPFPTPAFDQNIFYKAVGFLLGLAMTMATMYPVSRLVKSVVEEKESRMREIMKIMGLLDWAHQASWFITSFVLFLWITVTTTLVLHASVFPHSDILLLFGYFFTFCMSEITLAFLLSAFFSKAKLSAIVAPVVVFVTVLPRYIFYSTNRYEQQESKYVASLLSPTAFAFGADIIADYEYAGVGIQFSNMNEGLYNFSGCLQMMIADFFLYAVLAWYLDQVIPLDIGSVRHPLFFLQKSYWFNSVPSATPAIPAIFQEASNANIESIGPDAAVEVVCHQLVKRYENGKLAVKGLDLVMIKNEITCLLGSNGAGKTTTISMLTGIVSPTEGDCFIWGHHLTSDMAAVRKITGICPQHNVLFPSLTVREHLIFFGRIKGMSGAALKSAVTSMIADVGLVEKTNVISDALSGGMKRKLSLAIALIGDPKFVLLDEPTSGMDPYSRRATWELLQRSKAGRTILLTTHYMDEADILGDRIAIMTEGRLRTAGSSLFLKSRFGVGYILTVTKARTETFYPEAITAGIQSVVGSVDMSEQSSSELLFRIPLDQAPRFAELFQLLKTSQGQWGVGSYGISITTLEQVFISLARESKHECVDEQHDTVVPRKNVSSARTVSPVRTSGEADIELVAVAGESKVLGSDTSGNELGVTDIEHCDIGVQHTIPPGVAALLLVQYLELLRKRFIIASRDMKGLFFQIIFPAIQILLVLLILTIELNPAGRTLTLNSNIYDTKTTTTVGGRGMSDVRQHLSTTRMDVENIDTNISRGMSRYLLNTYSDPGGDRFGSFVFNDTVRVNVTVDWYWVQDNIDPLLSNDMVLDAISAEAGSLVLSELLTDVNRTLADNIVDDAIDNIFGNLTSITIGNVTIRVDDVNDVVDSILDGDGETDISFDRLVYRNRTLIIVDVEIVVNNVTLSLGNVSITLAQLQALLPDGTIEYSLSQPSPYSVMHNSSSPHGVAAFAAELTAAAFVTCTNSKDARYLTKNHPLPLTAEESLELQVILAVLTSLFILIPLCYIPASFVVFAVKERTCKSKHLQLVSSVSPYLYWVATYTWDLIMYLFLVAFIIMTLYAYGQEASRIFIDNAEALGALTLLLLTYGSSALPLSYLYSFLYTNHSTAQISVMTINFITGFVAVFAYYAMANIPSTKDIAEQLVHVFRIWPPYNIGEGLLNITSTYFMNAILGKNIHYLSWEVTGRNIVYMTGESGIYFALVLLSEASWLRWMIQYIEVQQAYLAGAPPAPRKPEDDDVVAEKEIIQSADPSNYALLIRNLVKTYSGVGSAPKYAVRGVSLGCVKGERFGLLGVNGAGKTTTLGILTGDIALTSGEAYIEGYTLTDPATRQLIGYCPQVDPLLELMTAWETLRFFGRVRGMSVYDVEAMSEKLIDQVGLRPHADRVCGTYSGGNKRKLSLAVALIGDPKVLFLDEPSSGMDPEARRHLWEVIAQVSDQRSVVITTHSMEECEAICNRVGIMVSGRLQCLGTCQHLKSKYGASYQLDIRCVEGKTGMCVDTIQQQLTCVVEEMHATSCRLRIDESIDLAAAFALLEQNKQQGLIQEYSLSQATLEQIFIGFAKEQEEEEIELINRGNARNYEELAVIEQAL